MVKKEMRKRWDSANCCSIIIGKDVSKTGHVIYAHNEDDTHSLSTVYLVPRKKHEAGETITFKDGGAVIPQVPETYAYYWSEVRCQGGIAFADCFVNEFGLSVASNSARPSKDMDNEEVGGEIGYGLRRLVTERAKNAREALRVIADLVETYGYYSSRTYNLCDPNEAWVVQIPRGHVIAARRVPDDEVYFMPNWFSIRNMDFSDTEHVNYYWSEDLVPNAIRRGYYTPQTEGDYSDFDFAKAYQEGGDKNFDWYRADTAWPLLLGHAPKQLRQFSEKPDRKLGIEDCKAVLHNHFDGQPYNITENGTKSPHVFAHFALCNAMTEESTIVVLDDDPKLTVIYRSVPKPCVSPFVPWFLGIEKVPDGFSWMDPERAQQTHFDVTEDDLRIQPDRPYWAFQVLTYLTEANYALNHEIVSRSARELEKKWMSEVDAVKVAYRNMKTVDEAAAGSILTSFTEAKCKEATRWALDMIQMVGERQLDAINNWDDAGPKFHEE